ncbi:GlxA family transcriptional regulator [Balneatrix alpica]|uniref:GlxA family transcriptional regulator n=1 Tax=Balneatrix alpica TaxID=75684 RepID=A0ABV5Z986_9GAMM|nr:GlxA family transcriptional regulator [Balneatrix alpica]
MTDTKPKGGATQTLGFLLLDHFTMMSLASAIEPLRMANQLSGKELYRWHTLSPDGGCIRASDGLQITPDASFATAMQHDVVIICGGVNILRSYTKQHLQWLQSQARKGVTLGAICTGSYVLAAAGLLDNHECSIHWENISSMQEAFPKVNVTNRLFSVDRERMTCTGGIAPLDMMLNLIQRQHGHALAAGISEMFMYERVRSATDQQRIPLRHMLGTTQPKLVEIVALMEANLEEPIGLDELANYVQVSRRQLERLFQKYLHCSPSRYYLQLRLNRARQLLKQTSLSIIEVASACGFVSTPHFSKCYREFFGVPPRDARYGLVPRHGEGLGGPVLGDYAPVGALSSNAMVALADAQAEPTFGSVRVQ